jgi:ABC-type transporter Mla MlaB component
MFPFFKKGKGGGKPAVPDAGRPLAMPEREPPRRTPTARPTTPAPADSRPAAPPAPFDPENESIDNGFEVQEINLQMTPQVEEAVMLYANGRTGEATATLNRFILDHPDTRDPQPWRILFDIYEVTGQRQPFEDLAMDFAVRFERSPPTWRAMEPAPEHAAENSHPTFAFDTGLSPQDKARLDHFLQECATAETVVLDFSKTSVPGNDSHAKAMLDCMARVTASGKAIHLIGGEGFLVRLNAARADGHLGETVWLILLMLLQMLGRQDEFDAAAVDYAVQFEMSPPSYLPPKRVSVEPAPEDTTRPSGTVFPMRGVIGPGSAPLFEELRQFAAPLATVEIDLGQVSRVDFTMIGLLMDAVMKLAVTGKKVVLRDANEMVGLLLQMVGIGQFASIQPRVRK